MFHYFLMLSANQSMSKGLTNDGNYRVRIVLVLESHLPRQEKYEGSEFNACNTVYG